MKIPLNKPMVGSLLNVWNCLDTDGDRLYIDRFKGSSIEYCILYFSTGYKVAREQSQHILWTAIALSPGPCLLMFSGWLLNIVAERGEILLRWYKQMPCFVVSGLNYEMVILLHILLL